MFLKVVVKDEGRQKTLLKNCLLGVSGMVTLLISGKHWSMTTADLTGKALTRLTVSQRMRSWAASP